MIFFRDFSFPLIKAPRLERKASIEHFSARDEMKTMRSVAQLIVRPRRRSHMGAETICLFCAERARATYLENLKASLLGNSLTPLSRAQHFLCSFGSVKYFNLIYSSRLLWRFFLFRRNFTDANLRRDLSRKRFYRSFLV